MSRSGPPLRAVQRGETAPRPAKPLTITEAIANGDYLAELKALHRRIGLVVNDSGTSPRDLAALVRRQVELSREIQGLRAQNNGEQSNDVEDGVFDPAAV